MAYNEKALKKAALTKAKRLKLCFHSHVAANIGICLTTYYQHEFHLDEDINSVILENKTTKKLSLMSKMMDSDSSASNIFVYKLLASPDELEILYPPKETTIDGDDDIHITITKTYNNESDKPNV
jgi:hypothetical protein